MGKLCSYFIRRIDGKENLFLCNLRNMAEIRLSTVTAADPYLLSRLHPEDIPDVIDIRSCYDNSFPLHLIIRYKKLIHMISCRATVLSIT